MEISPIRPGQTDEILNAIKSDPEWNDLTNEKVIDNYRVMLESSITYACYKSSTFCGFVRAFRDEGFAIYVSELFVKPSCRNQGIGHALLQRVKMDYANMNVFVLSDEDGYYEKLNYKKVGSIFEL